MPKTHAEVTAITRAQQTGAQPQELGVTRVICDECKAAIRESGDELTSDTTAVWPK